MQKIYLSVLCMLISLSVFADAARGTDANITGHVINKTTGEHIPFASVSVKGSAMGAVSDSTGHYMINNLPAGSHRLVVNYLGFEPIEQIVSVEKGRTYIVHFALDQNNVEVDEIVVTGNRYATKRRETTSVVNLINAKMFERTSAVSPAEVLDFQPGSRVEYNCGNCGVPQLRINGLSGQYSQVLLDNRPIFSSLAMVYGLEQMPASMIERVEVVRGGGSALYGSNAIGGTVNIITKEPSTSMVQLTNQSGLIGGNKTDINTSLNGSVVSSDFRSGVYLFSMLRSRQEYDRNGDGLSEIPQLKSQTVGGRAFHKIGKRSKLGAEYHYIHEFRRGGDMFDMPAHEANIAEQLDHNISGGGLNYDYESANGANSITAFVVGQIIDRNSYFGTEQNLDAYGKTKDKTYNAGAQWIHRFQKLWFMPSVLTGGVDYMHNSLHDKMLGYHREIRQTVNLTGVYAQNEWSNKQLSILIGGRLDKHTMVDKPIFSPRFNVRYAPSKSITLRASYGSGYRAPQTYDEDLHVGAVGGVVSLISVSPDLKPEYSNTVNFSFDYWKTIGNWQLNFLTEFFYTKLDDVFALVEKGQDNQGNVLFDRVNASGAKVIGVNNELRIARADVFNLQIGYTYQQSRYRDDFKWSNNSSITPQKKMFRAPDSYGYFTMDYKPLRQLTASFNGSYTGSMFVQHTGADSAGDFETNTPTFVDLSFKLAYDFIISHGSRMQVSVSMKNLLDDYQRDLDFGVSKDSKYIYGPMLPRSYFIGLKYSF